jgi:hypothetical protein
VSDLAGITLPVPINHTTIVCDGVRVHVPISGRLNSPICEVKRRPGTISGAKSLLSGIFTADSDAPHPLVYS